MKKLLVFTVILLCISHAFAGGLLTNGNQSAQYIRMLSRNASTGVDAVYFNPAGLMKMDNGFYFALQNRSDINIKLEMPPSRGAPEMRNPISMSSGVPAPPERQYQAPPDFNTAGNIFNVPTQGYAESYQQVGLLVAPGGSPLSGNGERTLVPLFGRRTMASRNKWNYYMRTDGLNPVQVPIRYKNRDCDDDNGCDEIYQGDEVSVPAQGQTYKANIYRQKSQVYNPFSV